MTASAVESVPREGPAGEAPPTKMDQNTPISITDRKKSLEANTAAPVGKSVKTEYGSSFSIQPLIDFFNRAFRCETSIQEPPIIEKSTIKEEYTEDYSE